MSVKDDISKSSTKSPYILSFARDVKKNELFVKQIHPAQNSQVTRVWSKGDNCLCPWAEDGQLYEGFIRRLVRHSDGRVFARVAFVGYKDEEEEVEICKLQKSSVLHIGTKKLTSTGDGTGCLFRPLSGNEEDKRIKEKFSSLDYDQVKHTSSEALRSETQSSGKKIRQPLLMEPVGCRTTKHRPRGQLTNQNARICDKGDNSDESGPEDSRKKFNHDNSEAEIPEMTETPIDARAEDTLDPVLKEHAKPGTSDEEPHPYDKSFRQHTKDIVVKRADISRHSNQECGSNTNQSTSSETEVKRTIAAFSNDDLEKPRFGFPAACPKVPHVLSSGEPVYQIPAPLNQYLRDYQRAGVQFLYDNFSDNTGAILGDDMGLGKTVQVIGFLSALLRKQANREDVMRLKPKFIRELSDTSRVDDSSVHKPFLIIGPGSVLYNWLEELETWGHFTARKYHGTDKAQTLADVQRGRIEIVVTTYETYRDNVDDINSVKWCAVIVDEVHKIKGLNSQISVALRKIKTRRRFGLTGTALQNNLIELWAILDWARPGFLGSLNKFEAKYVKKIERGQKHDATKRELAEARQLKETFGEIRSQMMLRRTKKLIADQLPEKDDNIVFCKLTELQTDVYKAILTHPDMRLILTMREPCDCGSRRPKVKCCHEKTPDGTPVRHLMFTYMSLLMKAANHVALLIPDSKTSEAQKKHAKEICEIAFQNHPRFVKQASEASFRTLSDPKYCGKMKVLCGLLSVFQKSHSKILLFSYSTKLLNIVEQYVISVGYEFRRIDGSVNSKRRMEIVHEFNNDDNIFICLISTKAGGLGLNLTGANVVIVFDPNWNPSYDLQAQDRAYRIGQRRNVRVFRLVSAGTIEENVYLRQVYKQQLDSVAVGMGNAKRYFHGIQGDKREKGELFGLKNMFSLRTGDNCLTMDILKRNENLEAGLKNFHIVEYVSPSGQGKQAREETNDEDLTTSEEAGSSENDSFMDIFLDSDNDDVQHEDEREEIVDKTVGQPAKALVSVTSIGKGKGPGKGKSTAVKGSAQPKQSFSSVSDVFDNCGVLHVHENPAVVGASRAEDHMTRCALQDVFELRLNSQAPAMHCEPLAESSDSETESPKKKKKREPDYNHVHVRTVDDTRFLIGQTPKSIKRQQFQEISTFLGCASQIEFAEKVLSMSAIERVEMLNKFYQSQNPELPSMFSVETVASPENKASTPATGSGTKRLVSKSKGLHSQIQRPTRLIPKKVRKGLKYESSESMELSPPENLISQSDLHAASTSCGHSNLMDQSEKARHPPSRKKELSTGKSADNQSEKQRPLSENQSESVLDEMILGNRSLPKRSPAPRKKTQTRIRVTKTTPQTWKCNEEGVSFPKTLCLDTWQGKNMVSTKSDSYHACESIQVDDLLDEMTVENNPRPDNRGSFKLKESSGDKFSVLDDIFMTKKYSVRRKPPPSTRSKQEHVTTVAESVITPCSTENSVNVDLEDSTKDLFESLDVVHGDTLKTKRSLDVFRDSSKWKRRERKRYVPEKPDTMSEQVDKLIKRGKTEYENMFASGKMRKLSREKPTQIDDLDEPRPKDDGSGKYTFVNSQSLSLFSGQ